MSAPGPESIPTSADPRSHRPTKRRALTPVSAQAASVDALFAKPEQHIRVPDSASLSTAVASRNVPPEIVSNVQGSSAGAGSGEFHVYKASRRREYERLRDMDNSLRREKDQEEFDKDKTERDRKDEERTRKNREKREKLRARKAKKGKGGPAGADKKSSNTSPADGQSATEAGEKAKELGATTKDGKDKDKDDKPATSLEPTPGIVIHDDD
ncbi:hypothetical protein B0T10DRAFT_560465 [Thelonectria olida]|uniref:DUF1168-domain-containing protein n=1 Tax=Thelonectria olida TaxID=1576542 RepID=A0A9P8W921_9HYPO|nr:hypothetical protein B0T10DRAFT_560465 [Thelonectria olida]